jgi:ribonuclease-3
VASRRDNAAAPGQSNGKRQSSPNQAAEEVFGHRFRDPALLTLALTHRSLAYEMSPEETSVPGCDNEQLEFIGDAVLGLVVAEALYRRFPDSREGELTRLRASLVSRRNLAEVGSRLNLGEHLLLGRGEDQSGGRRKPALVANGVEAVIAALYLDGGLEIAREFIHRYVVEPAEKELFAALRSGPFSGAIGDYKSALQERLQAAGRGQPEYVTIAQSGPDHQKRFHIEVRSTDAAGVSTTLASAEGTTKKQAQQEAARLAFADLVSGKLSTFLPNPAPVLENDPITQELGRAS